MTLLQVFFGNPSILPTFFSVSPAHRRDLSSRGLTFASPLPVICQFLALFDFIDLFVVIGFSLADVQDFLLFRSACHSR